MFLDLEVFDFVILHWNYGFLAQMSKNGPFLNNGTTCFKNVNNCLNTNIYSYLETSSGQSSNLFLNVVHFFITSVDETSVAA